MPRVTLMLSGKHGAKWRFFRASIAGSGRVEPGVAIVNERRRTIDSVWEPSVCPAAFDMFVNIWDYTFGVSAISLLAFCAIGTLLGSLGVASGT